MKEKILIIGMNYIGDTLFTTPLIKNLFTHYKDSTIDIVNGDNGVDILKNNPYINKIITRPKNKNEYKAYIERLKNEKYTIGYAATPSFYGAYDLYKAGIKIRAGVNSEARGILLNYTNGWKKHERHIIDTILSTLTKLEVPILYKDTEIYLTKEEINKAKDTLANYNKACIVHLGSTRKSKRYPINKFVHLLKKIKKEINCPIILIGSGNDDLALSIELKNISTDIIDLDLTNKLNIRELSAIISLSYSFIGGDSSPLHIASSFNIHTLGIYGDTYSSIYGARGKNSVNTKGHEYCPFLKSYYCEHFKRGCKSMECLNNLSEENLFNLFCNFYKQ